jgi:surfactin synthase thioesterase subunit
MIDALVTRPPAPETQAHACLVGVRSRPAARLRLFCFPYAGGTPSVFRDWRDHVSPEIEIASVLLPGRGMRLHEAPYDAMGPVVREVTDAIERSAERPFAFFGHSMGALVAFEVAHALRARGRRVPLQLFVSACRAPHLHGTQRTHELPSSRLIAVVRELGSVSEELGGSTLLRRRLPLLRADLSVCERYELSPREPLACPITAFGATGDPLVSTDDLEHWSEYTRGSFVKRVFAGDHFFLHGDHRGPLLRTLRRELDHLADFGVSS